MNLCEVQASADFMRALAFLSSSFLLLILVFFAFLANLISNILLNAEVFQ